ncbi:MAG TPA: hypothetical protein PLY73_00635, partial [Candidatus Ozemobacteraceae bacterium]|nr:hypothetical protein [Candidatus Ozemobacteraceae bacterium]
MSDMECMHLITPRRYSPASLFAFWASVFFLPGLLIVGLIQTVVRDHEQQLRHVARGRLIQQLRLFERELDPSFYIESVATRILANLGARSRQGRETDVSSRLASFQAAWRAETGALPLMTVFGGEDLSTVTVAQSDSRIRPPLRIVSAWFRGLAGMEQRKRVREGGTAGAAGAGRPGGGRPG